MSRPQLTVSFTEAGTNMLVKRGNYFKVQSAAFKAHAFHSPFKHQARVPQLAARPCWYRGALDGGSPSLWDPPSVTLPDHSRIQFSSQPSCSRAAGGQSCLCLSVTVVTLPSHPSYLPAFKIFWCVVHRQDHWVTLA